MSKIISRRKALTNTLALTGVALIAPLVSKTALAQKAAAIPNAASETEGVSKALGYCADADKATACPNRKQAARKDQYCKNCQFYTAVSGQDHGPCQLIPGKNVAAKGWCNSYARDPKKS